MRTVEDIKTLTTKEEVTTLTFNMTGGVVVGSANFNKRTVDEAGNVLKNENIGVPLAAADLAALPVFQAAYDQLKELCYAQYDATLAKQAADIATQIANEEATKAQRIAQLQAQLAALQA